MRTAPKTAQKHLGRRSCNGGYGQRKSVPEPKKRPLKQNIGRMGAVKAPKS